MNTNFSDLDIISKYDVIKMAFNHKLKYKLKLGLSKKIKFGIEIEALGTDFIRKLRQKNNIYFFSGIPAYKPRDIYGKNRWILYHEETLYDENGNQLIPPFNKIDNMFFNGEISYDEYNDMRHALYDGGEITSPILKDNVKSWKEIENILNYMKKNIPDLRINESCAFHTHFDIEIFNNNPELLYSFIILLAENEEVLTRFYCGEYTNLRKAAQEWAKPIKPSIELGLYFEKDMNSYKSLITSIYLGKPEMKENSFDFWEIYSNYYKYLSNTFENRIANGTLSPTIIQNNIMLMGFLMEYVASGKYDVERGIYRLKKDEIYLDPFYLADMLPIDEFKLDFLTQYYKDGRVGNSDKLVKSKRIFY